MLCKTTQLSRGTFPSPFVGVPPVFLLLMLLSALGTLRAGIQSHSSVHPGHGSEAEEGCEKRS